MTRDRTARGLDLAGGDAVIYGDDASGRFGSALWGSQDLTGDGEPDLLGFGYGHGIAVFSEGVPAGDSLVSDSAFFISPGYTCDAVESGGDINGDGVLDVLADLGLVRLFLGPLDSSTSHSTTYSDGGRGFGTAISIGGDIDGDGYDDVAIGDYSQATLGSETGGVFIFDDPSAGFSVDTSAAVAFLEGEAAGDRAGLAVELVEDLDGDGVGDIVVGADRNDTAASGAGAAYILFGPISGTVSLSEADVRMGGESASDYAGAPLAAEADVDGDDRMDLLVGATDLDVSHSPTSSDNGAVYLILGSHL